jgi:protein TonB
VKRVRPARPSAPDIADAVLAVDAHPTTIRWPLAFITAFAAHALLLLGARHAPNASSLRPATQSVNLEAELDLTALEPPPPPLAEPETAVPARRPSLAKPRQTVAHPERSSGTEAAEAASVIARAPESTAPVDLTADAFVTGEATAYGGGVTTPTGTSPSPGAGAPAQLDPHPATASTTLDRSTPVSLATESWSCPWPREADAEQIDEQTVILRVIVTADGDSERATVLSDPGHGFGPAALACALRTHFTPARGAKGAPIRATSPPIRVRFTR